MLVWRKERAAASWLVSNSRKFARPPEKGIRYVCGMAVACVAEAMAWRAVAVDMYAAWRGSMCV